MTQAFFSMFVITMIQNASFTLVSRARNSSSFAFHAGASLLSNAIYLLVLRHVITHLDSSSVIAGYLVGSVTGSVLMHWFSMKFLEKGKRKVGS
jgi:putative flippase GtrA